MTAYEMAIINAADGLRLHRDYGAIAPGRKADLLILDDYETVAVSSTMIEGQWVWQDGVYSGSLSSFVYPDWSKNTMRVGRSLTASDMCVMVPQGVSAARIRALAVTTPKSEEEFVLAVDQGVVLADPGQGVSSIVVIDRHKASERIGKGFVSHVFVQRGAIASTVSHDAHNLMVIGASHSDMAVAANRSIANRGGYVLVLDGEVLYEIPLPVAGLMSEDPLELVAERIRKLVEMLSERLGCPRLDKVLLRVNFLSLPNIPDYGFTDYGMMSTSELITLEPVLADGGHHETGDCLHHP